jgi:hypothetical protein
MTAVGAAYLLTGSNSQPQALLVVGAVYTVVHAVSVAVVLVSPRVLVSASHMITQKRAE